MRACGYEECLVFVCVDDVLFGVLCYGVFMYGIFDIRNRVDARNCCSVGSRIVRGHFL